MFFQTSENPIIKYFIGAVILILFVRFGFRYYKNIYDDRKKNTAEKSKEGRIQAQRRDKAILPWVIQSKKGTWETDERRTLKEMELKEKEEFAKEQAAKIEAALKEEE